MRGANYQETLAFHRSATASTSSLIVFPGDESEDEVEDEDSGDQTSNFDFHSEPPSPSSSDYPLTKFDYASDYASSSAYDSYLSDTDILLPSIPSTSMSTPSPPVDHSLRSPPRKKTKVKYRYKSRTYTNSNKATLLEAESILDGFPKLVEPSNPAPDTDDEDEPPRLKRKRSSRNTTANYCFSARGNALDPNREKPKRRGKSKAATSSEGE